MFVRIFWALFQYCMNFVVDYLTVSTRWTVIFWLLNIFMLIFILIFLLLHFCSSGEIKFHILVMNRKLQNLLWICKLQYIEIILLSDGFLLHIFNSMFCGNMNLNKKTLYVACPSLNCFPLCLWCTLYSYKYIFVVFYFLLLSIIVLIFDICKPYENNVMSRFWNLFNQCHS